MTPPAAANGARSLPQDEGVERALLGAALLGHAEVLGDLDPAAFHRFSHQHIAAAILRARDEGWPPEPKTIADLLDQQGLLEQCGGLSDLLSMIVEAPTPSSTAQHRAIVDRHARSRQLIGVAAELSDAGYTTADPGPILDRLAQLAANANPLDADRFLDGYAWILDRPPGTPAVWGEDDQVLWAQGEPLLLVGPTGVGKTTVTQQIILARLGATEPSFLGYPVDVTDRPVLYLACDRPSQIARSFARTNVEHPDQLRRLVVWQGPPPKDFARHPTILTDMARRCGAGTVIIDSLKDVALKISDDETGAGLNRAMQLAVAEGIEVAALHHQRKGQGGAKPRTLEDVYGSTWITAGAGSVIILWGNAGSPTVELTHLKQPAAPVGPLELVHDHNLGTTTVSRGPVDALVVLRNSPKGVTAAELAQRSTPSAPTETDAKRAKRQLDRLVTRGLAHMTPAAVGGPHGTIAARYHAVDDHHDQEQF